MKKKSIKRVLSMVLGTAMLLSLIPATVLADDPLPSVRYVDSNGQYQTCSSYSVVDATDNEWETGWYVVESNDTKKVGFQDRIEINGDVKLILNDTTVLHALRGIHVSPGNRLTIYGRSIDLQDPTGGGPGGTLVASTALNEYDYAAIGGNAHEKNGTITICSGRVSAEPRDTGAAGIGTGNYTDRQDYLADTTGYGNDPMGGTITICKAYVAARGGYNAAAIGGGDYADAQGVMVKGGTVRAIGNANKQQTKADDGLIGAAAIGGGREGCLTMFGMNGGDVIAASCGIGSGVGDGYGASRTSFRNRAIGVSGGSLLAISSWGTAAMMGGKGQDMSKFHDSVVEVYDAGKISYLDVDGWVEKSENVERVVTLDISEYKNHNLIYIEPCDHAEHTFVCDASSHTEKCATCRTSFGTEKHHFLDNSVCEVCGYEVPVVFGVQPYLTGRITLSYFFVLSDTMKNDPNAYVSFTSSGKTWKIKFKDAEYLTDEHAFRIDVPVDAMNLADSIVINVYNGNNEKQALVSRSGQNYADTGFSYSIKEYAEHINANGTNADLATAIYNYGAMVCNYFKKSYGAWEPYMSELAQVTEEDLAPYALSTNGKSNRPDCITRTTICVSFDSDNTLRITYYLNNASDIENLTFTLDGQPFTPKKLSDKAYAIDVENIAAPDLDVPHTFVVSDSVKTYTIEASAMSYALTSIKSGNDKRANLGKAFYLYNQAANAFFATQSNETEY